MKQFSTSVVAAALLIFLHAMTAAATTISAPFVTVHVGDTFTIPISIADAVDLTDWQFDLSFTPTVVQANSVTEGPFMSDFGTTVFTPGVIDNVSGSISLVADLYADLAPFPFGSGVLANIEFHALAVGVSPLVFSNTFLNLSTTGFDVMNGRITVLAPGGGGPGGGPGGSTPVPEPTSLMLLASGLTTLAQAIRRRGCLSCWG